MEFSEENRSLLKEFCKVGLTKNNLVELWERLCTAIDAYHITKKNAWQHTWLFWVMSYENINNYVRLCAQ